MAALLLVASFSLMPSCRRTHADLSSADLDGTLVFASSHDGNAELYSLQLPNGMPERLTSSDAEEQTPVWSPNGERIAYASDADGDYELYVMDGDGSHIVQLTHNQVADLTPSWSPEGSEIVFTRNLHPRQDEGFVDNDIFIMNADGTKQRLLVDKTPLDHRPDWSPDGTSIVFESALKLYISGVDSPTRTRLISDQVDIGGPKWAPDGQRIVFTGAKHDREESALYLINRDGSNLTVLPSTGAAEAPGWSADGDYLVYSKAESTSESSDIVIMEAESDDSFQVTEGLKVQGPIDWF